MQRLRGEDEDSVSFVDKLKASESERIIVLMVCTQMDNHLIHTSGSSTHWSSTNTIHQSQRRASSPAFSLGEKDVSTAADPNPWCRDTINEETTNKETNNSLYIVITQTEIVVMTYQNDRPLCVSQRCDRRLLISVCGHTHTHKYRQSTVGSWNEERH